MYPVTPNALRRFDVADNFYMRDNIQEVSKYQDAVGGNFRSYTINNLRRSDAVVLRTVSGPY